MENPPNLPRLRLETSGIMAQIPVTSVARMLIRLTRLWNSRSGTAAIEYAMIALFIGLVSDRPSGVDRRLGDRVLLQYGERALTRRER